MKGLKVDKEEASEIWLEDNGFLENDEQEELDQKAKINKSNKIIDAKTNKSRAKRVVQKKENPIKEKVIAEIAKLMETMAEDVVIENKTKIISFRIGEENYKIDLVQKRKGK
jgi:hypothetical protein